MKKNRKTCWGAVNIWSLKEKICGMTFVNPNIPALQYGNDMDLDAANTFAECIKNDHHDCIILECRLILNKTISYIGAIPDQLCLCCGQACIEIKYPYSINYTEPNERNLHYLHKDGDVVKLKQNHKYLKQCLMQMGVTKTKTAYFVVWTTHEMVRDYVTFDKELWESIKSNFEIFTETFI